jgi:hypothetical protein
VKLRILLAVAIAAVALPTISAIAEEPVCPTVKAPDLEFGDPIYIDKQRAGGEPVSVVAQDGSIIVSAHAGTTHIYKNPSAAAGSRDFLLGYTNQTLHWRSTDGGDTWQYIGLMGQREGPHTLTSTGFSDPDLTIDAGGRIYDTEIDLANVAVFSSDDDGQSFAYGNPEAGSGDRPWLTGQDAEEVFLYINSPKTFWRSTNGGLTFSLLPSPPISSKAYTDPLSLGPDGKFHGLIGPTGNGAFAISDNDGASWQRLDTGTLGPTVDFFDSITVDRAGNVYQASAGGYGGSSDTNASGSVTFAFYERATGFTNDSEETMGGQLITIPAPEGDMLWPWLTAGDDGRVAVSWYQNFKGAPDDFYMFVAYTHNAHGTFVTCSDGSQRFIPPQFTVVNASERVMHHGKICLGGTGCNANTNFEGGDRRLGDFFTINFDTEGNLFVVGTDTMLKGELGGPKPVGNPLFVKQSGGDPIIADPVTTRKTRCLWPFNLVEQIPQPCHD